MVYTPSIIEVKCNCNRVLSKKVSQSKTNPGRVYYKCSYCDYFDWEDKLTEINRNLRDTTLISNREMPASITQKAPQNLTNGTTNGLTNGLVNGHFPTNLDNNINSSRESEVLPTALAGTSSSRQSAAVITPANENLARHERLINAKKAENDFLRNENEKIKNENEKIKNENEKIKNENEKMKQINDSLEKGKLELSERIKLLENAELKKKSTVIENQDVNQIRLQNKELDSKISDLTGKNAQLMRTNDDLTTKLVSETSKLNLKIGSLEKEILDLRGQLIKLKDDNNSHLGSEDKTLHKKIIELEQENSDLKEQIRTFKQENSELKSAQQVEKLCVVIEGLTKRITELSNENQAFVEENIKLKQENKNLRSSKHLKNNDLIED